VRLTQRLTELDFVQVHSSAHHGLILFLIDNRSVVLGARQFSSQTNNETDDRRPRPPLGELDYGVMPPVDYNFGSFEYV